MPFKKEPKPLDSADLGTAIGAGLHQVRRELGMTQKQIAARIGLTGKYYARLERGQALPSVPAFYRIVTQLQVDATALLGVRYEKSPVRQEVKENPALARLIDQLRDASKERVRLIKMLVDELEEHQS